MRRRWPGAAGLQGVIGLVTALTAVTVLPVADYALAASRAGAIAQDMDTMSPAEFQAFALQVVRDRFPDRKFAAGKDVYTIVTEDGFTYGLTNLRAQVDQTVGSTADRKQVIADFFENALKSRGEPHVPATWKEAAPLLRPLVIGSAQHAQFGTAILTRPFAADMYLTYVIDLPSAMMYVSKEELTTWGISLSAVHDAAIENLDRAIADKPLQVMKSDDPAHPTPIVIVGDDDGYAAARLAVPAFRKRLHKLLGEPYFVGTPNRDILIAWSKDHPGHAGLIERIRKDAREQSYPISGAILTITNGEPQP